MKPVPVNSHPAAELQGIEKIYITGETKVHALRGIDIKIEKRAFITVAGPSGSGKTTMLNIIGCLESPTNGKILIDGVETGDLGPSELARIRREKIGFVFQTFNLIRVLTAVENVEFPLVILGGMKGNEIREKAVKALSEVGLSGLENRRPDKLSGGQQQRVAIARALVKSPSLVLADEPTANLDSTTGHGIMELMKRMNREKGVTFVFSTHDPMVMDEADTVVILRDGKITGIKDKHPEVAERLNQT